MLKNTRGLTLVEKALGLAKLEGAVALAAVCTAGRARCRVEELSII
jgi:hypothetical protein